MTTDTNSMGTKEREEVILQFLDDRGAMFKPKALYDNLDEYENITFGYKTVWRRLQSLKERELVEEVDDTSYVKITDRGREFLAGDLDADDLED